jgi:hypothetical protein
MKQLMNWIYIAMTISAIGFIVYANLRLQINHKKKVDTNIEPYKPDAVMDSMNMECGEYHGREGQSEYGKYQPNKCLQW